MNIENTLVTKTGKFLTCVASTNDHTWKFIESAWQLNKGTIIPRVHKKKS